MEIIKRGYKHFAICTKCGTELNYNKYDLNWTHTEQDYYYIVCPECGSLIWLYGDEEHHKMYKEAWDERKKQ